MWPAEINALQPSLTHFDDQLSGIERSNDFGHRRSHASEENVFAGVSHAQQITR